MPVHTRNQTPVHRPFGLVAHDPVFGGQVELRLHGVGGTTPEDLLGDLAPERVAGDRIAGFYRSADQLDAGDAEKKRHIEAYSWGGLTSRSALRVLWVLMLPFALANLAGWMCRPNVLASKALYRLHRFVVRLAGVAMTIDVIVMLIMVSEDLIAYQCAASESCQDSLPFVAWLNAGPFDGHPARAMAVGALLPILMLLLFDGLSRASAGRYERVSAPSGEPVEEFFGTAARPQAGLDDADFWRGYQAARRLSALHIAAGFAVVAGVLAWTTHVTFHGGSAAWGGAIAAVSAGILLLAIGSLAVDSCLPRWTQLLVTLSVLSLLSAVTYAWALPATSRPAGGVMHMRWIADGMYVLVLISIVATLIVIGLGKISADADSSGPRFTVLGPAVVLAFAFGITNAIGALMIMRLGAWIGFPQLVTSQDINRDLYTYTFVGIGATWALVAGLAAILAFAGVVWWRARRRGKNDNSPILDDYADLAEPPYADPWRTRPQPPLSDRDRHWLAGIAKMRYLATVPRSADRLLLLVVVAAAAAIGVMEWRYWHNQSIAPVSPLATAASSFAWVAPLGIIAVLRWGWRSPAARRHIGIAWDVATFWPRAYQPFAPPCYAERAVPELQRRIWYLQVHGAQVTIAAHSQGSVIAAAALMQQSARMPGSTVALLTFGSPLDTLYRWAFPAYFSPAALESITAPPVAADGEPAPATVVAWKNCYYLTDYIGNTAISGAANAQLPDPPAPWYVRGEPRPAIGSHSGYWADPAVWTSVATMFPAPVPRQLTAADADDGS